MARIRRAYDVRGCTVVTEKRKKEEMKRRTCFVSGRFLFTRGERMPLSFLRKLNADRRAGICSGQSPQASPVGDLFLQRCTHS
ncbi:MAG: hypothetical protein D6679_13120 [Candidatus Hydrogenedentota bacterium]|nr:MAG: hypothetical protein D6679_13120 [Candidatus Hydrogenedentota bacterium]